MVLDSFCISSRRRHTRCSRDWSSDVCSSDLASSGDPGTLRHQKKRARLVLFRLGLAHLLRQVVSLRLQLFGPRLYVFALQIGRASCREGGLISVGAGSLVEELFIALLPLVCL